MLVGLGLAGGQGLRFRPLTLKAPGYMRAKAAVPLLGKRVIEWILALLKAQGIREYVMVTKGKENRCQIRALVGYGEQAGVHIRYSPISLDGDNAGSGDALLSNLEYFDLTGDVLVFPTDTIFDFDLPAMLDAHRHSDAMVTLGTAAYPATRIAGRYGLVCSDFGGRVRHFVEKPSLHEIAEMHHVRAATMLPPLPTSAGIYLVKAAALRCISAHPDIAYHRTRYLDIGGDVLPWLVAQGFPVQEFRLDRMGDLGNISSYLETMVDLLHGRFVGAVREVIGEAEAASGLMIDPDTLRLRDPQSGLTLAEKIACGLVTLRPPVRIGKYAQIYPHVTLRECNIDDEAEIDRYADIRGSSIGMGAYIGPGAQVAQTVVGTMARLCSTVDEPIVTHGDVALGDEVHVERGVHIARHVQVYPRLFLPPGLHIPADTEIINQEQVAAYHPPARTPRPTRLSRKRTLV